MRMKRWWFRYAISQLIEKSIILRLLFILIMQLITESINYCTPLTPNPSPYAAWWVSFVHIHLRSTPLPPNSISTWCTVALALRQEIPAGGFIYLFGMSSVLLPALVSFVLLFKEPPQVQDLKTPLKLLISDGPSTNVGYDITCTLLKKLDFGETRTGLSFLRKINGSEN